MNRSPALSALSAVLVAVLLVSAYTLPGCETLPVFGGANNDPAVAKESLAERVDSLESRNQQAHGIIDSLQERIADYQEQLDAIPDDGQIADQIRDAIERTSAELAKVQAIKDQTDQAIEATRAQIESINADPSQGATGTTVGLDGIAAAAGSAGAVLPPPWNTGLAVVSLGLAGVADFLRRKRKKEYAEELAMEEARHAMVIAKAEQELKTVVYAIDNAQKADPELMKLVQKNGSTIRATYGPELNEKIKTLRMSK